MAPLPIATRNIRLSPEVVKHFKSTGPGWQSRIDTALRRMIKKAS
ncbi:BrnA antitoxin family protein [Bradyrhizobium diazoefficiens]|nr:BrnA antitoxin family protein [Bradyrhizobium diazoefficiens]MBR0700578.1 BrnA antitoxin family protein [Bradyrhizobium diazoefficiens]MBR0769003.1 BrnA antitoxin family protein [Bradyrhizobium diazoefficiens]